MKYERKQLDCGCEAYIQSGETTRTCNEAQVLVEELCNALEAWLYAPGQENLEYKPKAVAADRALCRNLAGPATWRGKRIELDGYLIGKTIELRESDRELYGKTAEIANVYIYLEDYGVGWSQGYKISVGDGRLEDVGPNLSFQLAVSQH